jgi:isopenicillin N synthase-like dioxygenase
LRSRTPGGDTIGAAAPAATGVELPQSATLELADAQIPLIDLEAIARATGAERTRLIQEFGDGLRGVGFIAVKADQLTPIIEKMYAEESAYFRQPLGTKMRDWHDNNGQTGFSPQGAETAAGAKFHDKKEFWHISPGLAKWPTYRPSFQKVMTEYHQKLTKYLAPMLDYLQEYLGEEIESSTKSVETASSLLRLAYYPAPDPQDPPQQKWAAPHEDLNLLTLLPPATCPGLQLINKQGEWMSVNVPPGYLIVNTGEQLEKKTAGWMRATRHQVVNPGGEWARQERFSAVYFGTWSSGLSLAPLSSCVKKVCAGMTEARKKEYLQQYPDVTVEENLLSRLIELKLIPEPSENLVAHLRGKGLLKLPPETLRLQFPHLF